MKKKLSFPHTYVIIVVLIALAVLLTWIVPANSRGLKTKQADKWLLLQINSNMLKTNR